jgi:hypothetical protein
VENQVKGEGILCAKGGVLQSNGAITAMYNYAESLEWTHLPPISKLFNADRPIMIDINLMENPKRI